MPKNPRFLYCKNYHTIKLINNLINHTLLNELKSQNHYLQKSNQVSGLEEAQVTELKTEAVSEKHIKQETAYKDFGFTP